MRRTHDLGLLANWAADPPGGRRGGVVLAAAQSLGYTQSAVSREVAALEATAGRRLFDRSRTGVTLTPAGARLLSTAVHVLDELDIARRELTGETETVARPVRLGAFATAAATRAARAGDSSAASQGHAEGGDHAGAPSSAASRHA